MRFKKRRTDMAEVRRRYPAELVSFHCGSSASLVEGLGVEGIPFLPRMGHEPKDCGSDVMAVALEVLDKLARALVVVLEERYKPCHVYWSGRLQEA